MSTTTARRHDWEAHEGIAGSEPAPRNAGSRRDLLGGAASGFALAASGLLLPDWLAEEAEAADNHPVWRILERKERQRTQRRRRLAHRRKVNRRQRGNDAHDDKPGSGLTDYGIEFQAELTGGRAVKVDFYTNAGYDRNFWKFTDRETLAMPGHGGPTYTFTTTDRAGALWIDDRYLV